MPLRIPGRADTPFLWECNACGDQFQAALDRRHPREVRSRVSLAGVMFRRDELPVASARFQMFAKFQAATPSRRADGRMPAVLPCTIITLDELRHPEGDMQAVMTRDISGSGAGLMHDGPLFATEILLMLPLRKRQLPVQVIAVNAWQAEGESSWESGWKFLKQVSRGEL